jgi:hypothetical protein
MLVVERIFAAQFHFRPEAQFPFIRSPCVDTS